MVMINVKVFGEQWAHEFDLNKKSSACDIYAAFFILYAHFGKKWQIRFGEHRKTKFNQICRFCVPYSARGCAVFGVT